MSAGTCPRVQRLGASRKQAHHVHPLSGVSAQLATRNTHVTELMLRIENPHERPTKGLPADRAGDIRHRANQLRHDAVCSP